MGICSVDFGLLWRPALQSAIFLVSMDSSLLACGYSEQNTTLWCPTLMGEGLYSPCFEAQTGKNIKGDFCSAGGEGLLHFSVLHFFWILVNVEIRISFKALKDYNYCWIHTCVDAGYTIFWKHCQENISLVYHSFASKLQTLCTILVCH